MLWHTVCRQSLVSEEKSAFLTIMESGHLLPSFDLIRQNSLRGVVRQPSVLQSFNNLQSVSLYILSI
jgi:hypothetical protein